MKIAKVTRIRFHDLRHTAATLAGRAGVPAKVLQEMLGHSQISLTMDLYSHVLPSMQEEAAAKISALFASLPGPKQLGEMAKVVPLSRR